MSATTQQVLVDELAYATAQVFKTMVFTEVHPTSVPQGGAPRSGVVATVAFTGKTSGLVVFSATIVSATHITASMLGMSASEVGDELPDAMGELTNMIAGLFRTRVAHAHNETWAISIPSVTIGSDFYTRFGSDVQRQLCPFKMGDHTIFVELIVTRRTKPA
jgi:chemotaxis protein CheX